MSERCAECDAELADAARFCNRCGHAVANAAPRDDDPTGEIDIVGADTPTERLEPDFESLATTRLMDSVTTDELERTARITATEEPALDARLEWGDGDRPFDDTIDDTPVAGIAIDPDATTMALPRTVDSDPTPPAVTPPVATRPRPPIAPPTAPTSSPIFRPTVMAAIGVITLIVLLIGLTADLVAISTTAGSSMSDVAVTIGMRTGVWHVDDLASNLPIAGLLAAIGLAIGAVAVSMGRSWGAGLIGGSGLATAGIAGLCAGLVEYPIGVATAFAAAGSSEPFTVTITRDLGYWAVLAAGAIGVIAFFASINDMVIDRLNDLNPIVAAIGALAAGVAAIGPMIPVAGGTWSMNWTIDSSAGSWPTVLLVGRAVQLVGLAIGGIIGFLSVRRFGLGLIAGVITPVVWMALSTWIGWGSAPIGPGHRAPGGASNVVSGLSVVGIVATATVLAIAGAIAWDRQQHRPSAR